MLQKDKMNNKLSQIGTAELLVRFYDKNDEEALSEFFLRFKDLAFRIAYNVLGNAADAEDIMQQTFVQLLKKQANCKAAYDGDDYKVKSWLLAIIYNAARMQYNSKKKNKTYELCEGANVESPKTNESENRSEKDGVISKLNNAIFDLPEKYRIPILMRYHQDMSIEDISKTLASQPGTIRSILSRGVSLLRNKLSNENITLSSVTAIELIANIPYPMPQQEISMSLIKSLKVSNPHVIKAVSGNHTNSALLLKCAITVTVLATVGTAYFLINHKELPTPIENLPTTEVFAPINKPVLAKEKTNWDFSKDDASDIISIQNGLVYEPELKAFNNKLTENGISNSAVVKMPLKFTSPLKISVVSKVTPTRGKYKEAYFNSLEFVPVIGEIPVLGKLLYHNKYSFAVSRPLPGFIAPFNHTFYLFDNVCVTTVENDVVLKVQRFDDITDVPNIGFIVANMAVEKIDIEKLSESELEKIQSKALEILNKQKNGQILKQK